MTQLNWDLIEGGAQALFEAFALLEASLKEQRQILKSAKHEALFDSLAEQSSLHSQIEILEEKLSSLLNAQGQKTLKSCVITLEAQAQFEQAARCGALLFDFENLIEKIQGVRSGNELLMGEALSWVQELRAKAIPTDASAGDLYSKKASRVRASSGPPRSLGEA